MSIDIIQRVTTLARDRALEAARISDEFIGDVGLSIPPGPKDQAFLAAPRPREAELRAYLTSLSLNQLLVVEAVMYCGRDKDADLAGMLKHVRDHTSDAKASIHTLIEKIPLAQYLSEGVTLLGDQVPVALRELA